MMVYALSGSLTEGVGQRDGPRTESCSVPSSLASPARHPATATGVPCVARRWHAARSRVLDGAANCGAGVPPLQACGGVPCSVCV